MFAIVLGYEVIGYCELALGLGNERRLVGELTIVIDRRHRRLGYAKIALATLIEWSFGRLPALAEVWGACIEDNAASIALMLSIGMENNGVVISNEGGPVRKYRLARRPSAAAAMHLIEDGR